MLKVVKSKLSIVDEIKTEENNDVKKKSLVNEHNNLNLKSQGMLFDLQYIHIHLFTLITS